jgi:hypothetical protein
MISHADDRNDFAIEDRDDNTDHYCRPYRTLRYSFFESLSDISERILGPSDLFCDPRIKAEIKSATEKPRLLEKVPLVRVPSVPSTPEPAKADVPIVVTTSKRELAEVLGKVVDVVVAAERRGSSSYDYSALNTLFTKGKDREHCDDEDEVSLTYQELQKIVTQIVLSSRESVKERIGIPGGIVISNLGPNKRTVDLSWAC